MKTASVHVVEFVPYPHRNERCAVGVLVRTEDGWQARPATSLRKARALDPACDPQTLRDGLAAIAQEISAAPAALTLYQAGVNGIRVGIGEGRIDYRDADELERGIQWVLATAVQPIAVPASRQREPVSRLFVSVKQAFDSYRWLASSQQTIADHRIVVRYPLVRDEGVVVDFALANGALHCMQTIDWRHNAAQRRTEANAKLLALGMAEALTHQDTRRYALVAGVDADEARPSMRLAERVCSDVFVHESSSDMQRLFSTLAHAMGQQPIPDLTTNS